MEELGSATAGAGEDGVGQCEEGEEVERNADLMVADEGAQRGRKALVGRPFLGEDLPTRRCHGCRFLYFLGGVSRVQRAIGIGIGRGRGQRRGRHGRQQQRGEVWYVFRAVR